MKKIIGLTILAIIALILLIVGSVYASDVDNKEISASSFAILLLIWLLSVIITVPTIKRKNKSLFLTVVLYVQVLATPLNALLGTIYSVMIYMGHFKDDAKDLETQEVANAS